MGRKSSRIKVKNVSDNRLLFSARELLTVRCSFLSKLSFVGAIRKPLIGHVEQLGSASEATKLASVKGLKSKNNFTFSLCISRVALLGHIVLSVKVVVPRESGRLGGLAGSVVLYVIKIVL